MKISADMKNLRMCKSFLIGIIVGLGLTLFLIFNSNPFSNYCRLRTFMENGTKSFLYNQNFKYKSQRPPKNPSTHSNGVVVDDSQNHGGLQEATKPKQKLVLIGVMTARKYLDTRATAVYNTWGRNFAGKILFFTGGNATISDGEVPTVPPDVPLIPLPGVDDSYPPQKKSFMMLKYMLDNYGGEYEWFLRADDDVYIHTSKLEDFLRSLNSNHLYFIGQAGRGSQSEIGTLNLAHNENFCMGGPGILFSQATLKKVGPHVSECLKDMLYSTHEDVEVGRCVRRFTGVSCTWAYEMQTIFYHNSSGERAFTEDLKQREVHRAITLHPVKHPDHLFRLHSYFQEREIEKRFYEAILLQRDLLFLQTELGFGGQLEGEDFITAFDDYNVTGLPPSLRKFSPAQISEIPEWSFIGKSGFSPPHSINPKQKINAASKEALRDVVRELMEMINSLSKVRGRVIEFKELLYGYHRVDPLHGEEFVLDILMTYRTYRGRKMTVPVRRHAYIQRPFAPLQLRFAVPEIERSRKLAFIVPLSGRLSTFERFLLNYQFVCEKMSPEISTGKLTLDLIVVYFGNEEDKEEVMSLVTVIHQSQFHPSCQIRVTHLEAEFSRGIGLETGISQCAENDLLFLVDVDIAFSPPAIRRLIQNTIQGTQVYFPIVFSEYSNEFFPEELKDQELFQISTDTGYWREFGFGIAAFFKSDFMKVGGFDVSIRGWGKEDVSLFDKFLLTNLTVFRSPDPELLHIYHPVECARDLPPAQYEMCLGSRASTLGSTSNLLKFVFKNRDKSPTLRKISKFLFPQKSDA